MAEGTTDTYPNNKLYEQKLYLMDMRTQAVLPLGRFVEPPKLGSNDKRSRLEATERGIETEALTPEFAHRDVGNRSQIESRTCRTRNPAPVSGPGEWWRRCFVFRNA